MRLFFGKFVKWRIPLIVSLTGFKHQLINTSHEGSEKSTEELREESLAKVDAMARTFRARHHIPGMALSISVDHETFLHKGYGVSDLSQRIAATPEMKGEIASVTKIMTTHSYMNLVVNDHRLNLHPTKESIYGPYLRQHLPDLPAIMTDSYDFEPNETNPEEQNKYMYDVYKVDDQVITPSMLMCHMAGVRQTNVDEYPEEVYNEKYYETETRAAAYFCNTVDWKGNSNLFKKYPRTEYEYSCIGYLLLGAIIDHELRVMVDPEDRSNFRDYLLKNMRELGMNDTMWRDTSQLHNIKGLAVGYHHPPNAAGNHDFTVAAKETPTNFEYSNLYPARGLISTVGDLVKFGNAYLNMLWTRNHDLPFQVEDLNFIWGRHYLHGELKDPFRSIGVAMGWDVHSEMIPKAPGANEAFYKLKYYKTGRSQGFASGVFVYFIASGNKSPFNNIWFDSDLLKRTDDEKKQLERDPSPLKTTISSQMLPKLGGSGASTSGPGCSGASTSGLGGSGLGGSGENSSGAGTSGRNNSEEKRAGEASVDSYPGCSKKAKMTELTPPNKSAKTPCCAGSEKCKDIHPGGPTSDGNCKHPTSGEGGQKPSDNSDKDRKTAAFDNSIHLIYRTPQNDGYSCLNFDSDSGLNQFSGGGGDNSKTASTPPPQQSSSGDSSVAILEQQMQQLSTGSGSSDDGGSNESKSELSCEMHPNCNTNPQIVIGIITNVNSVDGKLMCQFADKICEEIRTAADNGAFPPK